MTLTLFVLKMKKISLLCILLFSVVFFGCNMFNSHRADITGNWRIENLQEKSAVDAMQKIDKKLAESFTVSDEDYVYYSFLSFRNDSIFTLLMDNIYYSGKFTVANQGQEITLFCKDNTVIRLGKMVAKNNQLKFWMMSDKDLLDSSTSLKGMQPPYVLDLGKDSYKFKADEIDIFSPGNNAWRKKPAHEETADQISKRLAANVKYIVGYLDYNYHSPKEIINVKDIRSPFRYASNGVALQPWEETPPEWKNIFYNDQDARIAYNMLSLAFNNRKIIVPKSENWIELNALIIKQVLYYLKEE